jgi:Leucine-rich repeat (LRR) protein
MIVDENNEIVVFKSGLRQICLGGRSMTNIGFENYILNMSDDIKQKANELYIGNNNLDVKFSLKEFPNLVSVSCQNNEIEEIVEPLPINLRRLCIYNNKLRKLPKLPEKLKLISLMNNEFEVLPKLPLSLEWFFINDKYSDSVIHLDFHKFSFQTNKSLVLLLNKPDFEHDLTPNQLEIIRSFKQQQRDIVNFKEAICLKKNYDDLCFENRNNKILEKFFRLFVVINVTEFLGEDM